MTKLGYCVCAPARDEGDRLPILLDALAQQDVAGPVPVSICLNNTTDHSLAAVAGIQARWGERLHLTVASHDLAPDLAHAGAARRLAMDAGLARIDADRGVLISTDADTRPPMDWISQTLRAVRSGLDIVGGRIVIDEAEQPDPAIVAMRATLDRYWADVRAIEDEIDPCAWDAAPRHGDHTGASLAIVAASYRAAGGVPRIASGEDRALVENAVAAGARLGHPVSVWTRVSARTTGRAAGGMADHMRALEQRLSLGEPTLVPSFDQWRARATWRRAYRDRPGGTAAMVIDERALPPMPCDMALAVEL